MTHYYIYIQSNGNQVNELTRIFIVGVGTSEQATRDFLYLTAKAVDDSDYFEKRGLDSSDFMRRVIVEHSLPDYAIQKISARDLVRHFKANTAPKLSPSSLANAHHQRMVLDSNYRIFTNLTRRNQPKR